MARTRLRKPVMVDAPAIGRKGFSLDVVAFLKHYAALTALIVLLAFNLR